MTTGLIKPYLLSESKAYAIFAEKFNDIKKNPILLKELKDRI